MKIAGMAEPARMKYKSLKELSRAYWRVKWRSIGISFLAMLFWVVLYGAILWLIVVRTHHLLPRSLSLPLGLMFVVGGFSFMVTVLYRYNQARLIRCPHCNAPVTELQDGCPNPICQRCDKSIINPD
jgi:ABC-type Fe3+ transport system permease subunit